MPSGRSSSRLTSAFKKWYLASSFFCYLPAAALVLYSSTSVATYSCCFSFCWDSLLRKVLAENIQIILSQEFCVLFISTENLFLIVRKWIRGVNTKMLLLNLNQSYVFSFCKKRITNLIIIFFINWTYVDWFSYLFSFHFTSLQGQAITVSCSSITFLFSAQIIHVGLLGLSCLGSVLQ